MAGLAADAAVNEGDAPATVDALWPHALMGAGAGLVLLAGRRLARLEAVRWAGTLVAVLAAVQLLSLALHLLGEVSAAPKGFSAIVYVATFPVILAVVAIATVVRRGRPDRRIT